MPIPRNKLSVSNIVLLNENTDDEIKKSYDLCKEKACQRNGSFRYPNCSDLFCKQHLTVGMVNKKIKFEDKREQAAQHIFNHVKHRDRIWESEPFTVTVPQYLHELEVFAPNKIVAFVVDKKINVLIICVNLPEIKIIKSSNQNPFISVVIDINWPYIVVKADIVNSNNFICFEFCRSHLNLSLKKYSWSYTELQHLNVDNFFNLNPVQYIHKDSLHPYIECKSKHSCIPLMCLKVYIKSSERWNLCILFPETCKDDKFSFICKDEFGFIKENRISMNDKSVVSSSLLIQQLSERLQPLSFEESIYVYWAALRWSGDERDDKFLLSNKLIGKLSRKVLTRLKPGIWLNIDIITIVFHQLFYDWDLLLCKRDPTRKKRLFINSDFIRKLYNNGNYNYDCVKYAIYFVLSQFALSFYRWYNRSKRESIFAYHSIFIPINIDNSHWALLFINIQERQIFYLDSLRKLKSYNHNYITYTNTIHKYIFDEYFCEYNSDMPTDEKALWTVQEMENLPQQDNEYDCGMFVCMYADYLLQDLPIEFTQQHIPMLRLKLCYCILTQSLMYTV